MVVLAGRAGASNVWTTNGCNSLRTHLNRVKWLKRIGVPVDRAADTLGAGSDRSSLDLSRRISGTPLRHPHQALAADDASAACAVRAHRAGPGLYLRTDYWSGGPDDDSMSCIVSGLAAISDRSGLPDAAAKRTSQSERRPTGGHGSTASVRGRGCHRPCADALQRQSSKRRARPCGRPICTTAGPPRNRSARSSVSC